MGKLQIFIQLLIGSLNAVEIVDQDILRKKEFYAFESEESFKDITEKVLAQVDLSEEQKATLIQQKRRFILFQYPSEGLNIKSLLSFVETPTPKPLLLLLRGGSRLHGVPAFNPKDTGFPYLLATDATIVLGSYRDGLSPGKDEYGGEDVTDVNNLVTYLPSIENALSIPIDWKHFYAIGISRGGMQLFLALSRFEELQQRVQGIVSNCGILDIEQFAKNNPDVAEKWREHFEYTSQEWLDKRNPRLVVQKIRKDLPILILQGTRDPKIPIEDSRKFVEILKNLGFESVSYTEVEGGNHALKNKNGYTQEILQWLTKLF